jgi:hypothetical protein
VLDTGGIPALNVDIRCCGGAVETDSLVFFLRSGGRGFGSWTDDRFNRAYRGMIKQLKIPNLLCFRITGF